MSTDKSSKKYISLEDGAFCIKHLKNEFLLFLWLVLHKNEPVITPQYFTSNNINASINTFGDSTFFLFTSKSVSPWFIYNMELIKTNI